MKKNFVKKLALAMALVVTATSVNVPAASAAATPGFKSTAVKVKVGQTKKYNTVNTGKESDKAENRYSVSFKIGKTNIATIKYSKGSKAVKVTGVAAGQTTLRADFKNYATKKVTKVRIPVTVKPAVVETAIASVAQNTTTKLTATFVGDTSAVKAADFSIVRNYDNAVIAIKSATVDTKDATKVVIETYATMADGKEYTVTYNAESSAQFKATDGTVAAVNLDKVVVTAAQPTEVKAQTLDANGVVIASYTIQGGDNLEFTIETTDGYVDGSKLYLTEVGKTAKAKVVYHTWKYDDNGNEVGKIEKEFVITAVKDATVISNFKYTIAQDAPAWDSTSFKANTTIAANDEGMNVYFNIKDSNDNQVAYENYKVASSDTSKLIIDEVTLNSDDPQASVVGVSAGTAYILLKNATTGETVKTLPVTVLANRKASVVVVDASTFTLSNVEEAEDTKTVKLTVKDQYGVKLPIKTEDKDTVEVTTLSKPKDDTRSKTEIAGKVNTDTLGQLKFTGTDFVKGTYTFKVEVTMDEVTVNRTITVNVKASDAKTASSYELVVLGVDSSNKVDVAVPTDAETASGTAITLKIAKKDKAGVVIGYEDVADDAYTVKHSSGKTVDVVDGKVELTRTASSGAIALCENVKTGNYTVTAEFTVNNTDKKIVKTFTVEDTQVAPTVVIKDTDAEGVNIEKALAPSEDVVYYYDGVKYDAEDKGISVVEVTGKTTGTNMFVQYVTIKFPVNDNEVYREITIAVNKTFTNIAEANK